MGVYHFAVRHKNAFHKFCLQEDGRLARVLPDGTLDPVADLPTTDDQREARDLAVRFLGSADEKAVNACEERVFTIVAADDDLDDLEIMKNSIRNANVRIELIPVTDGVQLIDLLLGRFRYAAEKVKADVVLLDLNMPLMNGFQALVEIRRHPQLRDIPVYVVTTSRSEQDRERALELGAHGFYHKGAKMNDIQRIVREICSGCFTADFNPEGKLF